MQRYQQCEGVNPHILFLVIKMLLTDKERVKMIIDNKLPLSHYDSTERLRDICIVLNIHNLQYSAWMGKDFLQTGNKNG